MPTDNSNQGAAPLRILGRNNSFNVRKVLWACEELGIPFEREDYGRGFRSCDSPEFLELNPAAQVPVVIDDGHVMRESNAIVRYLAAKCGNETLYPSYLVRRQAIEQWMDWVAYDVTHALRGAFLGGQLREHPWDNEWFVEQGRADLIHEISLLDAHLAGNGPYVTGNDFTVADIPVGLVVNRWFMIDGLERPQLEAVAAYYELLSERPAYLRHGRNGLP
ncbi:MAG: glutathione S-transferase family protein [Rhodospirillales bacterium]|nr:glutathione S-transferase family protein [Rhodospirillales bacterium]MBO6788811.1 glutathione S-transferase family protein [Rhodospirillales bacterium]